MVDLTELYMAQEVILGVKGLKLINLKKKEAQKIIFQGHKKDYGIHYITIKDFQMISFIFPKPSEIHGDNLRNPDVRNPLAYLAAHIFEGLGKISGVNFCAALRLPLIFIAPLHRSNITNA